MKQVMSVQDNGYLVSYPSVRAAAKALNTNPSNIINCCNGKQKSYRGMQFYYIENGLALEALEGMYKTQ